MRIGHAAQAFLNRQVTSHFSAFILWELLSWQFWISFSHVFERLCLGKLGSTWKRIASRMNVWHFVRDCSRTAMQPSQCECNFKFICVTQQPCLSMWANWIIPFRATRGQPHWSSLKFWKSREAVIPRKWFTTEGRVVDLCAVPQQSDLRRIKSFVNHSNEAFRLLPFLLPLAYKVTPRKKGRTAEQRAAVTRKC